MRESETVRRWVVLRTLLKTQSRPRGNTTDSAGDDTNPCCVPSSLIVGQHLEASDGGMHSEQLCRGGTGLGKACLLRACRMRIRAHREGS